MTALWFLIWALCRGFNSVYTKKAQSVSEKTYRSSIYFIFVYALFQAVFLICIPPYGPIPTAFEIILYPVLFGIFYIISYVLLFLALGSGPTALTNVIYTFHTILPMITGIFLWNDTLDAKRLIGILFAAVTVYLFYQSVKNGKSDKVSLKWLIYIVAATIAIGIAVIFTQAFARSYPDMNKQYLIIYTLTSATISLVMLFFFKMNNHNKNNSKNSDNNGTDVQVNENRLIIRLPKYYIYVLMAAVSQNIVNLLFMHFLNIIPSTVLFPTINCIYILTFVIMGKLFFNEKLNRLSFMGICSSILSLILLNI